MKPDGLLDSTAYRLQAAVAAEQVAGRLPTLVAGLVRDGELVWSAAAGTALSRVHDRGPTRETQYRIGSITKTLTALVVMQLRDEGVVALTDRLDAHLPGVPYGDRTLRQLLCHASGMPAEPPGSWWERSPGVPYDALMARLDSTVDAVPADQQFHYSNVAFALLGEVVARHTGLTWFDAVSSRLLEPLGMRRTTYLPTAPTAGGFSVHAFAGSLTDEPSQDTGAMAPAGQLWSTLDDLARYAVFLADPDPSVMAPNTLREMTVVHSGTPDDVPGGAYGLGFRLAVAGERTLVGHTGSMPGFLAGLFVDRTRKTAAICLANGTSGLRCQGLPVDLLRILEQHEPAIAAAWEPTAEVPAGVLEVLGLWHWGNMAFTISYDDTGLVSRILDQGVPWCTYEEAADGFVGTSGYHTGETLRVVRRTDGSVSHLVCATFVFTRVPYDPEAPIPGR